MEIAIVTFDDFTDLDLFILWDLLNRVEVPGWRVRFLGEAASHTSSTGVEVKMHGALEEANGSDAVLFCSGKGSRRKAHDAEFLGALGLLKGRRATTYPSAELKSLLEGMGAEVVWESFVREGNVATAAQCLAGQHLAGWVIETLAGAVQREKALKSVAPLDTLGVEL